eukprot:349785-Chlamydomonas_euryale.AAC.18
MGVCSRRVHHAVWCVTPHQPSQLMLTYPAEAGAHLQRVRQHMHMDRKGTPTMTELRIRSWPGYEAPLSLHTSLPAAGVTTALPSSQGVIQCVLHAGGQAQVA